MTKVIVAVMAMVCGAVASALDMREIAFFTATPVKDAPKIDGVLDEAIWKEIVPNTNYYQYVHIEPNNPKLVDCPTELRIAYNEKGFYVGVRNYEDLPQKLARSATKNYDGAVYWNDCAELITKDLRAKSVYRFEVIAPDGKVISCREEVFAADGKARSYQVPFNDAPGRYELRLTDIATGLAGRMTLNVVK